MAIIVTGTTGRLGSSIVRALLQRGIEPSSIIATARDAGRLRAFSERGVEVAELDYDEPAAINAIARSGDVLVLVSSASREGRRVAQHVGVIDEAIKAGAVRIVYTSALRATTSDLLVNPDHKATEEHLVASGVPFTALRNGWYNENYRPQLLEAQRYGRIVGSVGHGRVASAGIADYADAAAVAASDDAFAGRTLELAGDSAWSYEELAATLSEIFRIAVTYENLPSADHEQQLVAEGVPAARAAFAVALDANIRDGLLRSDGSELSAMIGHPTTPLIETLRRVAEEG